MLTISAAQDRHFTLLKNQRRHKAHEKTVQIPGLWLPHSPLARLRQPCKFVRLHRWNSLRPGRHGLSPSQEGLASNRAPVCENRERKASSHSLPARSLV